LSFADLDAALGRVLPSEHFDAVIHAAAVGDFGVDPAAGKLDSASAQVIRLRPNPKLVDGLRSRSLNDSILVVAFKLTHHATPEEARSAVSSLFAHSGADLVVHNDLADQAGADAFPSEIHFPDSSPPEHCETRADLAAALERLLTGGRLAQAAQA
jgi:phosphopantothenoylcysteine decarboxylase/phosphopantothenate--cysteine ligase